MKFYESGAGHWVIWLTMFCILLLPGVSAYASKVAFNDEVVVSEGEVLEGDLVCGGGKVIIDGLVTGDIFVFTGELKVNGTVKGDIIVFTGDLEISGTVEDDVRAFAGKVGVDGKITGNLSVFSGNVQVREGGVVGGEMHLKAEEAMINGNVLGPIKGRVGNLKIAGTVEKDVEVSVGHIKLMPEAQVKGNLKYKSSHEAEIKEGAVVLGKVERKIPEVKPAAPVKRRSWWSPMRLFGFLSVLVVGLILVRILPTMTGETSIRVRQSFWKSLGLGFILLIAIPIAATIFLITIIGIPLAVIIWIAFFLVLYLSKVFVSLALGNVLLSRLFKQGAPSPYVSLIIGLIIIMLLGAIPFAGGFIKFAVAITGLGAFAQVCFRGQSKGSNLNIRSN